MIDETILAQLEQDLIALVESCKSDRIDASDAVHRYYELAEEAQVKMDMSLLTQEQAGRIYPYFYELAAMEDGAIASLLGIGSFEKQPPQGVIIAGIGAVSWEELAKMEQNDPQRI